MYRSVCLTQVHIRSLGPLWVGAALVHSIEQLLFDLSDGVTVQTLDRHLLGILILWVYTVQRLVSKQVETEGNGNRQRKLRLKQRHCENILDWLFRCIWMYMTAFSHQVCIAAAILKPGHFPSLFILFGAIITQHSHMGAHQNNWSRPRRRVGLSVTFQSKPEVLCLEGDCD